MGGCRCSYKTCESITTPGKSLHFFHYPVKAPDVCNQWIINGEKPQFKQLTEDQLRNKVVCEYHFEEKCFPNTQRKRLLKGSIPTLDGPALPKPLKSQVTTRSTHSTPRPTPVLTSRPSSVSTTRQQPAARGVSAPQIELLSANDDATLFVLDTSSIDFPVVPKSELVESYIYQNGSLLPAKDMKKEETEITRLSHNNEILHEESESPHIVCEMETNSEQTLVLYCENSADGVELNPIIDETPSHSGNFHGNRTEFSVVQNVQFSDKTQNVQLNDRTQNVQLNDRTQNVQVNDKTQNVQLNDSTQNVQLNDRTLYSKSALAVPQEIKTKYIQKINANSRDIANIKQFIRNNTCIKRSFHNKASLLRGIKRFIPPSLYSILKLSLRHAKVTPEDWKFFITLHEKSPTVYDMLSKECKWNLPDIERMKALLNDHI